MLLSHTKLEMFWQKTIQELGYGQIGGVSNMKLTMQQQLAQDYLILKG